MSATTMVDTYDTPMVDFDDVDRDIPMAASSSENWYPQHAQALPRMDEDGHIMHQNGYMQPVSLEVDMIAYEETTEYEMGEEIPVVHPAEGEQDTVLYDASVLPSPAPPPPAEIVQTYSENSGAPGIATIPTAALAETNTHVLAETSHTVEISHHATQVSPGEDVYATTTEENSVPNEQATTIQTIDPPRVNVEEHVRSETIQTEPPGDEVHISRFSDAPEEPPEIHSIHAGDPPGIPQSDNEVDGDGDVPGATEQHGELSNHPAEEVDHAQSAEDEKNRENEPAEARAEALEADEHSYHDPPPSILLTLGTGSSEGDQPEFSLFGPPLVSSASVTRDDKDVTSTELPASEETLVLLQHHPNLFTEPVSAVFDALRQEEYFSHITELVESEMALNAYDMNLVISEDNVYAREVSLRDLYAMHSGVGLVGPLRLRLQSVMPRFIQQYNLLRDHITRMTFADPADGQTQQEGDEESQVRESGEQIPEDPAGRLPDDTEQNIGGVDQPEEQETDDHAVDSERQVADDDEPPIPGAEVETTHVVDTETGGSLEDENQEAQAGHLEGVADDESDDISDDIRELDADAFQDFPDTVEEHVETAVADATNVDAEELDLEDDVDAEGEPDEQTTEHVDHEQVQEEGEEGYGEEFAEDGVDETGTTADVAEDVLPAHEHIDADDADAEWDGVEEVGEEELADASAAGPVVGQVHTPSVEGNNVAPAVKWSESSGSSAASLFSSAYEEDFGNDLNEERPYEELPEGGDDVHTNHFSAKELFDEDGQELEETNQQEILSDEDTLEDSAEDHDGEPRSTLLESEKLVSQSDEETSDDNPSKDDKPGGSAIQDRVTQKESENSGMRERVSRKTSKRSLEDSDKDEDINSALTSESPGIKRARVQ